MGNTNYPGKSKITESKKKTWTTGDKICNIYDIAGNVQEWTTEYVKEKSNSYIKGTSIHIVGSYKDYTHSATYRIPATSSQSQNYISFRMILYIK